MRRGKGGMKEIGHWMNGAKVTGASGRYGDIL